MEEIPEIEGAGPSEASMPQDRGSALRRLAPSLDTTESVEIVEEERETLLDHTNI